MNNIINRLFCKTAYMLSLGLVSAGILGTSVYAVEISEKQETEEITSSVESTEGTHTVIEGENLTFIAEEYGVTVEEMASYNEFELSDVLPVGHVLKIPSTELAVDTSTGIASSTDEISSTETIVSSEVVDVAKVETVNTTGAVSETVSTSEVVDATEIIDINFDDEQYNGMGGVDDTEEAIEENLISVNFINADIKDVLSILALEMGNSIIYKGDDERLITFKQEDITPEDAISYAAALGEVSYVYDGDIILVADHGDLMDTFSQEMYLTRIPLYNIAAQALFEAYEGELQEFGFDSAQMLVTEATQKAVWLQGTPKDLAKLQQIIYAIDRNENVMPGSAATLDNLATIETTYITVEELNYFLTQIGFMPGITMPGDQYKMYMVDSYDAIADVRRVVSILDTPDNAGADFTDFSQYTLSNITFETANQLLSTISNLEIITTDAEPMTLWMRGTSTALEQASEILSEIDNPLNNMANNIHYIYLNNVTAQDMEARLTAMNLVDVQIYTFSMPQFTDGILIGCAPDEINNIRKIITKLDVKSASVTLPVDSAEGDGATTRLGARRMIIAEMSGISASNFKISGNVSKDNETKKYVLYLTASPEDIQRVRDIVAEIDGV